ncbi:hypothetical protein OAA22_00195 [bacterium]|nr:hypothetical protein [bacterium]
MGTLRIKRGTKTALQSSPGYVPAEGELVYTTDSKEVFVGDGATTGGTPVSVSTQNLEDLGNVQALAANNDQILVYNGTQWSATDNPAIDIRGNIYGDDSTLLVDAINGRIVGPVVTSSVTATNVVGNLTGDVVGSVTGSVVGNTTGTHFGNVNGNVTGDIVGSVFADDSSSVIDSMAKVLTIAKITSTGNLQINATGGISVASESNLTIGSVGYDNAFKNGQLIIKRSSTSGVAMSVNTYHDSDNVADMKSVKHRGTVDTPASYQSGDRTMELVGQAYDGATNRENVTLVFETTGAVSNNVAPGKATFKVHNTAGNTTDFAFQNDGGLVMPASGYVQFGSVTTTQRNALTAANGMVIYNSSDNKFQGYENGSWINLV